MVETPYPLWNRDDDPFIELISADAIAQRVAELGRTITAHYQASGGEDVVVLGVLKGSIIFMSDLVRHIGLPVTLDFIAVASYGDATVSSGVVQITQDLTKPIAGKHVLIVE